MDKQKKLDTIAQEIAKCKMCQVDKIGVAVPGEGNPNAKIVFLGEAPGRQEAQTGRPFIGRSGQLLRKNIRAIGLKEDDVYITSPVKYLPKRGTPTLQDIQHGLVHTSQQLDIIQPKVIVLLGSTAVVAMWGEKIPILKRHGEFVEKDNRRYFVSLHPAAAIRFKKFMSVFEADFQKLKQFLKSA